MKLKAVGFGLLVSVISLAGLILSVSRRRGVCIECHKNIYQEDVSPWDNLCEDCYKRKLD